MSNIKDIAKLVGVSNSTVSRALNNHPDISEGMKRQVKEAARSLNYRPNAIAKGLIEKKTYTIGLMIPDISDPFFSKLANAVEHQLYEYGYQVVYVNTSRNPEKEKQFISNAISRQFDGLIITPDDVDDELIKLLKDLEMPVVFLRRRTPAGLSYPFVDVDHYEAACVAVNYLVDLGHCSIGFIAMPEKSFTGSERLRGYKDTMSMRGLPLPDNGIIIGGRTMEHGRIAMNRLYQGNSHLTAIFAANDLLGIGALEWLALHNISVPDNVSVMGFDNLEYANLHWIQLTTMEQPREEMGKKATELLLNMISDKNYASSAARGSQLIEARLVIRKSCKRLG